MSMQPKVITRFAPSPTGFMHIGGVRTALYAYLLARKYGGTFILRIEDTDKEREVVGSTDHIKRSLSWLGIDWDYGPDKPGPFGSCIQSERLQIYKKYAQQLLDAGLAYPDPYTVEEVEIFKKEAELAKKPFLFRNHRPSESLQRAPWDGKPLRFKVSEINRMRWHDAVRGDLEAGEEALDDFIVMKGDGYPTYNFAHIIDDHEMGVTHVLRGEEFISSTPKFLSLYQALGFTPPVFATLPPILREDRTKKLGKRDGAKDILEYRNEGYLPQAMMNMLALIGWNPGTVQEVFTKDELISSFDLDKVQKSGGVFNEEKLAWFNKQHIAQLSDDEFSTYVKPFIHTQLSPELWRRVLPFVREKISRLSEAQALFEREGELHFVCELNEYTTEQLLWKKNPDPEQVITHLTHIQNVLLGMSAEKFTAESVKNEIWSYVETHGKGDVLWPFRMAITGQERSPDPFVSTALVGRDVALVRIALALTKLGHV